MSAQGQSPATIDKERQIGGAFDMEMQIVRRACPGEPFTHIDLNAGSGWNDEFGVPGTPLVFAMLAERYLRRWRAIFYERDPQRAAELSRRLRGIPRCEVICEDNARFAVIAGRIIRPGGLGSILLDPNGWFYRNPAGEGCPVPELIEFCARHPRIDVIANLNLRNYKQMRGAALHHPRRPSYGTLYGPEDLPRVLSKRHGLISNLSTHGRSRFVRIVLRNLRTNDYRALGWYHCDSPEARRIYRYAETFAADRAGDGAVGQLCLFER
jgi:hypothetical protein